MLFKVDENTDLADVIDEREFEISTVEELYSFIRKNQPKVSSPISLMCVEDKGVPFIRLATAYDY
jgi:adenosine/AMP kinase